MKSKVLSSSFTEDGEGIFEEAANILDEESAREEEELELVKDGVPVGEPEHLVERMMRKLDSALRRRDENIKQAIVTLEEDNHHLRREVDMYRAREGGAERNSELEAKIQEVLDNMERLRQRTPPHFTPREGGEKELPPIDGKAATRHKRRSKSRAKSKTAARDSGKSSSSTPPEAGLRSKYRGEAAYQGGDSSTSSDTEPAPRGSKPGGGMQLEVLHTMVQTAQQDNTLLRQDLLVQKERESQLVKRNQELEAKLIRALTPRGPASPKGEKEGPVGGPALNQGAVVPPILSKPSSPRQDTKQVQAFVACLMEDKASMTDLPPPLTVESPTSSSPSKSESPLKEGQEGKRTTRKSRSKVKVKRGSSTMEEVTEAGEVFGRGAGVDGGTPSPSPSRGEKMEVEEKEPSKAQDPVKPKEITAEPAKVKSPPAQAPVRVKPKGASLTRQPTVKEVKIEEVKTKKGVVKESDKKQEPTKVPEVKESVSVAKKDAKKVTIEESTKKMPPQKEELRKTTPPKGKDKPKKTSSQPTKGSVSSSGNKLTVNMDSFSDTRSKVIEGDDFRVTITSNQDMVSCELSDREDEPGSPRKKIVITPKTPDKKVAEKRKSEDKKEEVVVAKKAGKIPIRQQYIKPKAELPAPQMYPSARPPMDQIPQPQSRGMGGASPRGASMSMSMGYPMAVDYPGDWSPKPLHTPAPFNFCSARVQPPRASHPYRRLHPARHPQRPVPGLHQPQPAHQRQEHRHEL